MVAVSALNMPFRSKVKILAKLTPMLIYNPRQYAAELIGMGDCINVLKGTRRYILGQIRLNSEEFDVPTKELLAQWIESLVDLSPLEEQICQEILQNDAR